MPSSRLPTDRNLQEAIEASWVEVLAFIYKAVRWKDMLRRSTRSPYDVFQHRLVQAGYQPDVPSAIEKLCKSLSLQAPPLPQDHVEFLRSYEKEAMKMLRKWTRLLTLKAAKRAKELKGKGIDAAAPVPLDSYGEVVS